MFRRRRDPPEPEAPPAAEPVVPPATVARPPREPRGMGLRATPVGLRRAAALDPRRRRAGHRGDVGRGGGGADRRRRRRDDHARAGGRGTRALPGRWRPQRRGRAPGPRDRDPRPPRTGRLGRVRARGGAVGDPLRRRQRDRQDDHDRQARQPPDCRWKDADACRGGHVPGSRDRAAPDLGRAARSAGRRAAGGRGPGCRGLRRRVRRRVARASTPSSSTPRGGSRTSSS